MIHLNNKKLKIADRKKGFIRYGRHFFSKLNLCWKVTIPRGNLGDINLTIQIQILNLEKIENTSMGE